jgi:hypothetical protein
MGANTLSSAKTSAASRVSIHVSHNMCCTIPEFGSSTPASYTHLLLLLLLGGTAFDKEGLAGDQRHNPTCHVVERHVGCTTGQQEGAEAAHCPPADVQPGRVWGREE